MSLIGKIFIVAILIMSILFMGLSLMVYGTHRNWRDLVENTTPSATKPLGLQEQLRQLRERNRQIDDDRSRTQRALQLERAARRQAISVLESRVSTLRQDVSAKQKEVEQLRGQQDAAVNAMTSAQSNLTRLDAEVAKLRDEIRRTQDDRNAQFQEVVRLYDMLNDHKRAEETLTQRNRELTMRLGKSRRVLSRHGMSEETALHNVPPKVDGYITAIRDDNLVEISLGSDQGLRVGHNLEVYRSGGVYLGRLVITNTDSTKSVARVMREFRQGRIRRGDRVATRLI